MLIRLFVKELLSFFFFYLESTLSYYKAIFFVASVFLLTSVKAPDKAQDLIVKQLQHEEVAQRVNAVLRYFCLPLNIQDIEVLFFQRVIYFYTPVSRRAVLCDWVWLAGVHTGFRTITLVLYIGSLPSLATWFPCGRGRILFILESLGQRSLLL